MTDTGAPKDVPGAGGGSEREEQGRSAPNRGQEQEPGAAAAEGFADAIGHLQTAAVSMVAAIRSALDGAEKLAREVAPLLDLVAEAARSGSPADRADAGPAPDRAPRSRVEHIPVSAPPKDGAESARPAEDEPGDEDDG